MPLHQTTICSQERLLYNVFHSGYSIFTASTLQNIDTSLASYRSVNTHKNSSFPAYTQTSFMNKSLKFLVPTALLHKHHTHTHIYMCHVKLLAGGDTWVNQHVQEKPQHKKTSQFSTKMTTCLKLAQPWQFGVYYWVIVMTCTKSVLRILTHCWRFCTNVAQWRNCKVVVRNPLLFICEHTHEQKVSPDFRANTFGVIQRPQQMRTKSLWRLFRHDSNHSRSHRYSQERTVQLSCWLRCPC
jgi:hypothetical protein